MPSDKERVLESIHAVFKAEKDVHRQLDSPDSLSVLVDASKSTESETIRVLEAFCAELTTVLHTSMKLILLVRYNLNLPKNVLLQLFTA